MTFAWPAALAVVVAAPVVVAAYVWSLRRRRKHVVSYSSVPLLRSVMPSGLRWRRHVPVALLVGSLATLGVASARPQMVSVVKSAHTSIVLAFDVSRSMCATDVDPNRLAAAQDATRAFIDHMAPGTRTGIVVFSGTAQLAVAPTTDRRVLRATIDGLTTGRGTAIGAAILKSLDAIAGVNNDVDPVGDVTPAGGINVDGGPDAPAPTPVPATPAGPAAKSFEPDIIVVLTDGANNRGIAPLDAVPYAVARGVRVYTIAFGTTTPPSLSCTAAQMGGDVDGFGGPRFGSGGGFGGGGGRFGGDQFGGRSPLQADIPTLQQVAQRTGAKAYTAEDASELEKVFAHLPSDVSVQKKRHEVSAWFASIGALFALAAVGASLRWSPYP
jgi:Ca-activated chloride channel family protein